MTGPPAKIQRVSSSMPTRRCLVDVTNADTPERPRVRRRVVCEEDGSESENAWDDVDRMLMAAYEHEEVCSPEPAYVDTPREEAADGDVHEVFAEAEGEVGEAEVGEPLLQLHPRILTRHAREICRLVKGVDLSETKVPKLAEWAKSVLGMPQGLDGYTTMTETYAHSRTSTCRGRLYAGDFSLQKMPRGLRAALTKGVYVDVDIVNANPCLLLGFIEETGHEPPPPDAPELRRYVEDRMGWLSCIVPGRQVPKEVAKEVVNRMICLPGDYGDYWQVSVWLKEHGLAEQGVTLSDVHSRVFRMQEDLARFYAWFRDYYMDFIWPMLSSEPLYARPRPVASAITLFLQRIERAATEAARREAFSQGAEIGAIIHDGFLAAWDRPLKGKRKNHNKSPTKTQLETMTTVARTQDFCRHVTFAEKKIESEPIGKVLENLGVDPTKRAADVLDFGEDPMKYQDDQAVASALMKVKGHEMAVVGEDKGAAFHVWQGEDSGCEASMIGLWKWAEKNGPPHTWSEFIDGLEDTRYTKSTNWWRNVYGSLRGRSDLSVSWKFNEDISDGCFPVLNGMVDLHKARCIEDLDAETCITKFLPQHHLTRKWDLPVDTFVPDPETHARFTEIWEKFFGGNAQFTTAFTQRVSRDIMTRGNVTKKIVFLMGPGNNGKTALMRILNAIYGNTIIFKASTELLTNQLTGKANSELDQARRARIALVEEPPKTSLCMDTIKDLTGGAQISTRDLWTSTTMTKMEASIYACANTTPELEGHDDAAIDRFMLVTLPCTFIKDREEYEERVNATSDPEKLARLHLADEDLIKEFENNSDLRLAGFIYLSRAYVQQRQNGGPVPIPDLFVDKMTLKIAKGRTPINVIRDFCKATGNPDDFISWEDLVKVYKANDYPRTTQNDVRQAIDAWAAVCDKVWAGRAPSRVTPRLTGIRGARLNDQYAAQMPVWDGATSVVANSSYLNQS